MFKTSRFCQEIHLPASHSLTPIRDYENDYFHKDDNKMPIIERFPYGKPKNYRDSVETSAKLHKRPASLVLDEKADPPTKKQFSPLNLRKFTDVVALDTDVESSNQASLTEFLQVVRALFESEVRYANLMELSNLVYRRALHDNRAFRNKLIRNDSNEELLLFGNIATISSISRLFISGLETILACDQAPAVVGDEYWDELLGNEAIQDRLMKKLDIGRVFNLHFLRIKTTYLTYSVTHRKQKELLGLLREGNPQLFKKWHDGCLKAAQMNKLELIFESPIIRLKEWVNVLSRMYPLSLRILREEFSGNILKALEQFQSFEKDVAAETKEFNNNAMYDFSLTPVEIIQSYGSEQETVKAPTAIQPTQRASQRSPDKDLLHLVSTKRDSKGTNGRASSIFSRSSSRYSSDSTSLTAAEVNTFQESQETEWHPDDKDSLTLMDHITKLKKIHRGLIALKSVIAKEDMLSLLDINLKHAKAWEAVIQCDPDVAIYDGLHDGYESSMYSAYVEKLQRQREEATLMKVEEMEVSVRAPLSMLIQLCERVRSRLRDLNALKKDYIAYLRERGSSTHDIKKDILGKHFQSMQQEMLRELPEFIKLVHKVFEMIVLSYHRKMLRYLEIAAGGDTSLIQDLESLGKLKKDVGKHFDILETFSASRYYSKRMVRDEWKFRQEPTASRVLRRLFEL
ncbi:hypothetical protein HG536_0D01460 [Torulaspora globosa]|uniref:DH domain-containing protein n=1 Tax=Torulaspora globosa TaxID=48254 RepID=A0A7G3ZGI8_9SACH|nr:uncharacterized protein HG536_0D01460 [Torulaspora globosa]QLL32624.1 hypothetical protein HG536_0D01460 [Torulaspora globosa]